MKIRDSKSTQLLLGTLLSLSVLFSGSAQAIILVEFESVVNFFNPGPLPKSEIFTGSFEIDDSVVPTSGGIKYFNGALDNFQFSIGGQSFGGTDGRLMQFTDASGIGGFMTGSLGGSQGTTFGTYDDGARLWSFDSMSFDWRGAAAVLFPYSDPSQVSGDLVRNAIQNDFDYALMSFNWTPLSGAESIYDNSLRIGFNSIQFTNLNSVPEPTSVTLLLIGLLGLRLVRAGNTNRVIA